MKKLIHINRNIIQRNQKKIDSGEKPDPCCRVQHGKKVSYGFVVDITGPAKMVYRPLDPLKCGAKLWIETDSKVIIDDETVIE